MFLGKFRKHIEEIRHKHPRLEVEIRMAGPNYFAFSEYFSMHIYDGDTFLHEKRILSASDLDSYAGDPEDLLIIVLDRLVEKMENSWKTYCGVSHYEVKVKEKE